MYQLGKHMPTDRRSCGAWGEVKIESMLVKFDEGGHGEEVYGLRAEFTVPSRVISLVRMEFPTGNYSYVLVMETSDAGCAAETASVAVQPLLVPIHILPSRPRVCEWLSSAPIADIKVLAATASLENKSWDWFLPR